MLHILFFQTWLFISLSDSAYVIELVFSVVQCHSFILSASTNCQGLGDGSMNPCWTAVSHWRRLKLKGSPLGKWYVWLTVQERRWKLFALILAPLMTSVNMSWPAQLVMIVI